MRKSHVAVLSTSLVTIMGFQAQKVVIAQDGKYEEDGLVIQALGACSYDTNNVRCWDMQGVPNPSLSERIEAQYMSNNGSDLSFKLHKKNRLLVIQVRGGNGTSMNLQNEQGGYGQSWQIYENSGGPMIQWLSVASAPDATIAGLIGTLYSHGKPQFKDVDFRRGEKAEFMGTQIEIGAAQPLPVRKNPGALPGNYFDGQQPFGRVSVEASQSRKWWSLSFGLEPGSGGVSLTQPLDKDGNAIRYVDKDGKIVSPVKYLESLPKGTNPANGYNPVPSPKYAAAQFGSMPNGVQGTQSILTNIDPSQIGKVRLSYNSTLTVKFSGFPLDPK